MDEIIQLRHALHQYPELSGNESQTARSIIDFFTPLGPDQTIDQLGGYGIACVFSGQSSGPTVLLRCELDALPIQESNTFAYRSRNDGVAHKCGHDGHMAILAGLGKQLAVNRPKRGQVVLLYQPAEETGSGAAAILSDPRFETIKPDFAFALHNIPGYPRGKVIVRNGPICCASRGLIVRLSGTPAHAAQPETGNNPVAAMCQLIQRLSSLPGELRLPNELALATLVGARLGDKAFGTAASHAEIWATLRSESNETMRRIVEFVESVATQITVRDELGLQIEYDDVFDATINCPRATEIVRNSTAHDKLIELDSAFRWSEDFGRFTAISSGALFGIGSGVDVPDLHNQDYDFPDELIPISVALLQRIIERILA